MAGSKAKNGTTCPLPFRQRDLADALGLSLVHTNKTLTKLKARKAATWADGVLHIHDLEKLTKLAKLTLNTREALLLHTVEEFRISEITQIMQVDEDNAATHMPENPNVTEFPRDFLPVRSRCAFLVVQGEGRA